MQLDVKDAAGLTKTIQTLPPLGQVEGAASLPVVLPAAQVALIIAAVGALAPYLDGVEGLLGTADGPLTAIPAGSVNGTALTRPAGAAGVILYLGTGDSVTFTIAPAAPTSAPATTITISGSNFALWTEALGPNSNLYVTARGGAPKYRFV